MSFCHKKLPIDLEQRVISSLTLDSNVSFTRCLTVFFLVQLYLPPDCMLNKDFLRQVLIEEKKLLKLSDVKFIEVPKFDELSVQKLFPLFEVDANMKVYFPDRLPKGRNPDRSYFFNVMNTMHPEYTQELIRVA